MILAGESQLYRDLLRFKPEGMSPNAWAVRAGVSRTVWADMRRHGNPSRRTLEKLLTVAGSSLAEFEALRLGPDVHQMTGHKRTVTETATGWSHAALPPIPLFATASADEWGAPGSGFELTEILSGGPVDMVARPRSLAADPDAFAVTIVGESMWPRFSDGRRVAVSPRARVAAGDDVLVRLCSAAGDGGRELVLIKHLVRRSSGGVELRQFTPDVTVPVARKDIAAVLKILGELI